MKKGENMELKINLGERSYSCLIEKGILKTLTNYFPSDKKVLIIKDKNVDYKYLPSFSNNVYIEEFEASEMHKSFEYYRKYIDVLIENNFSRSDIVCAIGGGVTGDLAGFVSSTYKRGCKFINCPTTTLSMVDSSIGGKVAINENNIKNIVGAFYQPSIVLIDPLVLETLPNRHFYNGMVEALKMGLIGDKSLYQLFKDKRYCNSVEEIIYKSLDLKRKIVEEDEREQSVRKLLNFGHTIGHAIESLHLDEIYHGEAVGIGMLYLITDKSLKGEVEDILQDMKINTKIKINNNEIMKLIMNDKKATSTMIDIIKVDNVGEAYIERVEISSLVSILERGQKW